MDQTTMPLYRVLDRFKNKKPVSFHVPGHKNGLLMQPLPGEGLSFLQYDLTELDGLDDLHHPEGAIKEAQELLSAYYGSTKSYFLVNGSTVGNLAAILAVCRPGDRVLVDRNCHKSVLHGLQLAKARPVFLFPEIDGELGLAGGFKETEIEQAFHAYPDIKACILTYPTYYGMVYDLQPIIEMAHRHHCLVVIDEAHGPHFHIGAPFPASAMDLGADAVVHSAHKMLPALTMGSFLHIKNAQFPIDRLEYYLSVLQTSSPSYLIMMSLDYARWYAANFNAEDIRYTMSQRKFLISRLKEIKGLEVLERGDQDPLKLLVSCPGVSGFDLQSAFEHAGVYPEMADLNFAVLVLPLLKEGMAFPYSEASDRINRALKQDFPKRKVRKAPVYFSGGVAGLSLSYEEMEERPVEWVSFGAAADRIAAKTVTPYPPGVPLLMPGERITASHIERIKSLRAYGAKFQADAHFKHEQLAVYL